MFLPRFKFSISMSRVGLLRLIYVELSIVVCIFTFLYLAYPSIFETIYRSTELDLFNLGKAISWTIVIWTAILAIAGVFYLYGIIQNRPAYAIFEIQVLGEKKYKFLDLSIFIIAVLFFIAKLIDMNTKWYSLTVFSMIFVAFLSNLFSKSDLFIEEGQVLPEPELTEDEDTIKIDPVPKPDPKQYFFRDYDWSSNAGNFAIKDFPLSIKNFEEAQELNKKQPTTEGYPYQIYTEKIKNGVTKDIHRLVIEISKKHKRASSINRIDNLLQFVHEPNFKYSYDKDSTERKEYARYPIETLVEKTGDCDCLAILAATLFKVHGYKAALIFSPGHCMAGVEVPMGIGIPGAWVEKDDIRYFICEATGSGWKVGQKDENTNIENVSPV